MIFAVLDHLWQSTLMAAAVAILAVVFRNAPASVRYGLWFTASVKFLVPFAALAALGRLLAPAIRPPAEAAPDAAILARAVQPFSPPDLRTPASLPHAATMPHASAPLDLVLVLLGVWALGSTIVLVSWMARWVRIRPLLRQAIPLALPAPMGVLATPTMMEPGLVGLWRPVLLVPQALFDHLDRAGIETLVAHEACHYRRRDNQTAAIHMLVEALFWFHPMVWWIGGRLVAERERACDEAVIGSGHDRAVYAESLLECCRLFLHSPLRCVAGASGSNLTRRVEMIMTLPLRNRLSRPAKTALAAAGVCALASPVAAGWLTSPAERQAAEPVAVQTADTPSAASVLAAQPAPSQSGRAKAAHNEMAAAAKSPAAERPEPGLDAARPAPVALMDASDVSLTPLVAIRVSNASLTPIANVEDSKPSLVLASADQALGPGHYLQRSGLRPSGNCGWALQDEQGRGVYGEGDWYELSTPPIAQGHVITNFRWDLQGDNRCGNKDGVPSADCRIVTDGPDRKTIRFRLYANRSYCTSYGDVAVDAPRSVTHSELVIAYDVQ